MSSKYPSFHPPEMLAQMVLLAPLVMFELLSLLALLVLLALLGWEIGDK